MTSEHKLIINVMGFAVVILKCAIDRLTANVQHNPYARGGIDVLTAAKCSIEQYIFEIVPTAGSSEKEQPETHENQD